MTPNHPITPQSLCNKGAAFPDQLYHKDRILYPLKSVGKRGEGKWARVSWDEAMDEIAASAALTKRTLYYHFASKDVLLAKVLEAQHALALAAFQTFGQRLAGSPETIIDKLFEDLAVWSDQPRWAGSGFTRLVIELADLRGHPARLIARRHKAMLEGHLADLLAKADVASPKERAREIWLLSEGAISMILIHGDRSYAAAAAEAAKKLIRSESSKHRP